MAVLRRYRWAISSSTGNGQMDPSVAFVITLVIVTVVIPISWRWHFSRAKAILNHWAQDNGYAILSSEQRWFRRGPFFFSTSEGQVVYYVTLRTPTGQERRGWVRCGGWWWGVLSDRAEVRWDE